MAAVITITNISKQVIPILVNEIATSDASSTSDIAPSVAQQMQIAAGAQVTIETIRVDVGQLDQLRRKKLISYS